MNKYKLKSDQVILMVIDLQEKLMKVMDKSVSVCQNTTIMLETAKALNIPVIITEQYPKGLGPTVPEIANRLPEDYYYMDKIRFSACSEEILAHINKEKRPKVIVVGTETHVCVLQTVRDLLEKGLEVHVLQDAVCSRFESNYTSALEMMKDMGAVISNTETAVFDLLEVAGTPEFKVISPLIK